MLLILPIILLRISFKLYLLYYSKIILNFYLLFPTLYLNNYLLSKHITFITLNVQE